MILLFPPVLPYSSFVHLTNNCTGDVLVNVFTGLDTKPVQDALPFSHHTTFRSKPDQRRPEEEESLCDRRKHKYDVPLHLIPFPVIFPSA